MAIVAEGRRERLYLPPSQEHERIAAQASPSWAPDTDLPKRALGFRVQLYGMTKHRDLFTARQLVALSTFSDLVEVARDKILDDATQPLTNNGPADPRYANAVATYLALAVSRLADNSSTLVLWSPGRDQLVHTFGRQTLSMVWDFAESSSFSDSAGDLGVTVASMSRSIGRLPDCPAATGDRAMVGQADAGSLVVDRGMVVCTDPPYYDNVGYADLSDFFYVWLRRSLRGVHPELFRTLLVPKAGECIADPARFQGSAAAADGYFEECIGRAFHRIEQAQVTGVPLTLFYAFRGSEPTDGVEGAGPIVRKGRAGARDSVASTGWEAMLSGLTQAGFQAGGTWPMRTERPGRLRETGSNALASSIVIACRPRPEDAPVATFKQFQGELERELPPALSVMTGRDRADGAQPWVDPIDLRQAAIGPGMAVYSRYSRVQKASGEELSVREALQEINEGIDRYFDEMTGNLDPVSRFCVQWYAEAGFGDGNFGRADVLARATGVDPDHLSHLGLLDSRAGRVALRKPERYPPEMQAGPSIWELCHRLVQTLMKSDGGTDEAARLYNRMAGLAEEARDLAYRLYLEAEKKDRPEDALCYNGLVASWTDIRTAAAHLQTETQAPLQTPR